MSRKKLPEQRQRHGETPQLAVIRATTRPVNVPTPEAGWLARTRTAWTAFWRDGIAQLVTPVDGEAARRLFGLYDARQRFWAVFLKAPYSRGSTGQQVLNPAGAFALQLDARIERLERAFGITPAARLQLGVTLGEAKRSLDDLAREAAEGVERVEAEEA